jgi:hypothetical protein
MDSSDFFAMLFGSDLFEHLVGELAIAAAARMAGDMSQAQMKAAQTARIEKLAVNLKAMLQRYVAGDQAGFKVYCSFTSRPSLFDHEFRLSP